MTLQGIQGIRGMQGMQGVYDVQQREKVADEFLAIFYKELLKQAFKPSYGLDEGNSSFFNTFGSDMLVDKLALELARSKSFSAANIFPDAIERNTLNE